MSRREVVHGPGVVSCCDLDNTLKSFWEVENAGVGVVLPQVMTEEERAALEKVKNSCKIVEGRYQVGVPWKRGQPNLPDNRAMAQSRLVSTEKNLKKNPVVAEEYCRTNDYVKKGYLRKVHPDQETVASRWYLPHFPVVRLDKSTTKVRIVFDCSAKREGVFLNDEIHVGPKLQQDLFDVLLRFRRNPVAVACDIKEMYMQIAIEAQDRPYFRMLWRDLNPHQDPEVFEFSRVVFGKNSAPMEAQFVAQENARKQQEVFPLAAETVLKSTHMDDSLDSAESDDEGIRLYHELKELWAKANMQARKWVSNSSKVMAKIPEEDRAGEMTIREGTAPTTKTLGLSWNSKDDVFTIPISSPGRLQLTKRNVLPKIATVFDPLGFVSPFVVTAKILLQELWARGYDWDDEIQDELATRIKLWFDQLESLGAIAIPRCLRFALVVKKREVVTFVDASKAAYGAISYLRTEYEDDRVSCRLIAAKSKVAPLNPTTIPRLELMAAVLGLRLAQSIHKVLSLPIKEASFFSDSEDVLWWVRGHGRDFRSFVANRVGEIQNNTNPSQWQHVSTIENPADICTQGASPMQLAEDAKWWEGPDWLKESHDHWPKMKMKLPKKPAATTSLVTKVLSSSDCDTEAESAEWRLKPERFSDWTRLVRLLARVKRVVFNMRSSEKRCGGRELTVDELKEAEVDIIREAQLQALPEDYRLVKAGKPVSLTSPLAKLNPRIDEDGLLRSHSRLEFAEQLPYDARFPIILPRGNWITRLIVKDYHEQANHAGGVNFIFSQLSQRYWISAGREEIREWEKLRNGCKRRRNQPASQVMAPLPKVRLRFTYRAFDQCGVDYAGPFTTIHGRGRKREKRYLCAFTCLSVRAVQLEIAWRLDTDAFLNAFTRFISRRGVPKEVVSDNGTNFVGAVNELKSLVSELDEDKIKAKTASKGVRWLFNPPAAPHFGGINEIMVKAAKKAIYAVVGNAEVNDEELMTVFTGAECLLNSRPLTYQSSDVRDIVPLTPNHFLYGQVGGQLAPEAVETTGFHPKQRWRKVQHLISLVWRRWLKEYLPTLIPRSKWLKVQRDLQVGDVVLVSRQIFLVVIGL